MPTYIVTGATRGLGYSIAANIAKSPIWKKVFDPDVGRRSSQIFTDNLFQVRLAAEELMQQSLRV